jgi:hypothetical protein
MKFMTSFVNAISEEGYSQNFLQTFNDHCYVKNNHKKLVTSFVNSISRKAYSRNFLTNSYDHSWPPVPNNERDGNILGYAFAVKVPVKNF